MNSRKVVDAFLIWPAAAVPNLTAKQSPGQAAGVYQDCQEKRGCRSIARARGGAGLGRRVRARAGGYQFPEWFFFCSFLPLPSLPGFLPSFPFPPELSVHFASPLCTAQAPSERGSSSDAEKEGENMEAGRANFVHLVLCIAPVAVAVVALQATGHHEEEFHRVGSVASVTDRRGWT